QQVRMALQSACPQIHQKKGEIVKHVARGDRLIEFDRIEQDRPVFDQDDVAQVKIAMTAADLTFRFCRIATHSTDSARRACSHALGSSGCRGRAAGISVLSCFSPCRLYLPPAGMKNPLRVAIWLRAALKNQIRGRSKGVAVEAGR